MREKISATIITLNEERTIETAIKSLGFVDEIIIVDSNSSDRTIEIAEGLGAVVHQNSFQNYGHQKNYAASLCQYPWIISVDSDEEVSSELQKSIIEVLDMPLSQASDLYEFPRLNHYCGKALHYGGLYPDRNKRLYKKECAIWNEPNVHESLQLADKKYAIGRLNGDLNHYSFPTINSQVKTSMLYAEVHSKDLLLKRPSGPFFVEIIYRPWVKFLELYFIKRGFLDGFYGFVIACNSWYGVFLRYVLAYQKSRLKK
jgi:glycosyltransferase involved in cell wall biosynthesis